MDQNFQNAPIHNLLMRKGGRLLEDSSGGQMAILDTDGLVMLKNSDPKQAQDWLKKHEQECRNYPLIMLADPVSAQAFLSCYPKRSLQKTRQYVWTHAAPPAIKNTLFYRTSYMPDFQWVKARYSLLSDRELQSVIENDDLYLAFEDEEPCGFAGIHLEGSMGMLEVFKDFRHRGYAREIEAHLIGKALEEGLIPYADVFEGNEVSRHLQESLGLEPMPEPSYWSEAKPETLLSAKSCQNTHLAPAS